MILFYRQFFMLHSKKSILQVKIQRLKGNCRHVRFLKPFLRWKFKKNLKRVQDKRWGLVFLHIQAQCSGVSCCKMVGAIGRPHWGCMGPACYGPIAPHKPTFACFGVFLKAHQANNSFHGQLGRHSTRISEKCGQQARWHLAQNFRALSFYNTICL